MSSFASRLNPANYFGGNVDAPESESAAVARDRAEAAVEDASNQPYPTLSRVPQRPEIVSRRNVQTGLVADRNNAEYTGSVVRDSGSGVPGTAGLPSLGQQAVQQVAPASVGSLPQTAELAALQEELAVGEPVRVAVVQFGDNSSTVPATANEVLAQVAGLAQTTGASVVVVGHASAPPAGAASQATEEANLRVSLARANSVAAALTGLGVNRAAIAVQGRGDSEPLGSDAAAGGGAAERRAEVFLRR